MLVYKRDRQRTENGKKQKRRVVWKCLKEYLKTKGEEEKVKLNQERKKLEEVRLRIRQQCAEEKWRKVATSRNTNEFWEAVREYI